MQNEDSHIDIVATLTIVHGIGRNKVIINTILFKASMENVEKMVSSINEIIMPWFTQFFDFLKIRVLLKDKSKA